MKSLGENIREYRLKRKLTQKELASLIDVPSGSVIYNWEKGTAKPDYVKIDKLCTVLQVTADQLLSREGSFYHPVLTVEETSLIKKYRVLDCYGKKLVKQVIDTEYERMNDKTVTPSKTRKVAVLKYNMKVSAGLGNFIDNEVPEELYVKDTKEAEMADYAVEITGDSMEPTFHHGELALIKKQDTLETGEIGIFVVNSEAFIKELGEKVLISHNKHYNPIEIKDSDAVYCLGKVLGIAEL